MRVYPAGPISSPGGLVPCLRAISRGLDAQARLREAGFSPFPVFADFLDIMRTQSSVTVDEIKRQSIAWLEVAEAVLLLPDWQESPGAVAERQIAEELGIPCFESIAEIREWREQRRQIEEQIAESDD